MRCPRQTRIVEFSPAAGFFSTRRFVAPSADEWRWFAAVLAAFFADIIFSFQDLWHLCLLVFLGREEFEGLMP